MPTITLSPQSGPAGTVVTVTVVRDTAPTPVTVTATTPAGVGSATFDIVQVLTVVAQDRQITPVSDDGLTFVGTFAA